MKSGLESGIESERYMYSGLGSGLELVSDWGLE